jgi:hypothetical protein
MRREREVKARLEGERKKRKGGRREARLLLDGFFEDLEEIGRLLIKTEEGS